MFELTCTKNILEAFEVFKNENTPDWVRDLTN